MKTLNAINTFAKSEGSHLPFHRLNDLENRLKQLPLPRHVHSLTLEVNESRVTVTFEEHSKSSPETKTIEF